MAMAICYICRFFQAMSWYKTERNGKESLTKVDR